METLTSFSFNFEKGDNLFELVFELDRRLQKAQNFFSPISFLIEAYEYLDAVLVRAIKTQPDLIDTVFLKLIDFFIKCNCNHKRSKLNSLLKNNQWMYLVKNRSEALKRLSCFWDASALAGDYEAGLQILNLMENCHILFFNQTSAYGIFYEAFSGLDPVGSVVYESGVILACSLYLQKLFQLLNSSLLNETKLEESIPISKFAAALILNVIEIEIDRKFENNSVRIEFYRILIICAAIDDNFTEIVLKNLPEDLKLLFSDLLLYLQ